MSARRRLVRAPIVAVVLAAIVPGLAAAHPLGNFTINHYAHVRVAPDRVELDVVIDEAEIPAFQERQTFDTDADGSVSDQEIDAGRVDACRRTAADLAVSADDVPLELVLTAAGLSFPPGVGGLSTMRLVCGFQAALPAIGAARPTRIAFRDGSFPDRIGWREIVATGSGVRLSAVAGAVRDTSVSERLTRYPADMIADPLADASLTVSAVPGGPELPPLAVADASAITPATADPSTRPAGSAAPQGSAGPTPDSVVGGPMASVPGGTVVGGVPPTGDVPGGIASGDLPDIFRTTDLTPPVLLLALMTAAALGAGHALTPGHGKTLMAAYLVGTRGTPRHALGLGLSVSLSHTVGILVLAGVVVGASDVLPPDAVVRGAPVVAAISIVAIGAWMLVGEWRRRRGRVHDRGAGHDHRPAHEQARHRNDLHRHGGTSHRHLPTGGSTITWRGLFALGLAGGLIPSTSALLILLGSIAAGRPAFGFVLVVAFGLGMAAVMAGIGVALVAARGRLDGLPAGGRLVRIRELVPTAAAVVVLGFGIYLTAQALGGAVTL
ncbi:MAG TPA: hypothetical protein VFI69_03240 [Candidatus Limnocylindrales bacterium]|nr:hypothetical protein [Candidatus Limnocylindrales bacterium]